MTVLDTGLCLPNAQARGRVSNATRAQHGANPAVRADWMFDVRSTCQTFYCLLVDANRTQLEAALMWLLNSVPDAVSIQEADALTDRLQISAIDAGTRFHQKYHQRSPDVPCTASPVEAAMHVWRDRGRDPRTILERWIGGFLTAFDASAPNPAGREGSRNSPDAFQQSSEPAGTCQRSRCFTKRAGTRFPPALQDDRE